MEERREVRVQTRDGREDGAQMSYGLMIETNFDNCFDLCIVFVVLNYLEGAERKPVYQISSVY